MFNFENVNFMDKLPEEPVETDFMRLVNLKNSIDVKLKSLENKMKINNVTKTIMQEEQMPRYTKAGVYFSSSVHLF